MRLYEVSNSKTTGWLRVIAHNSDQARTIGLRYFRDLGKTTKIYYKDMQSVWIRKHKNEIHTKGVLMEV